MYVWYEQRRKTYVGRDFNRFSLSSSVTRLAKLQKQEWQRTRGT